MLEALGEDTVHLKSKFAEDTPDTTWLSEIGKSGMVLVTADNAILSRPHEKAAFRDAKLTAFFLPAAYQKKNLWGQALMLIKAWPNVRSEAQKAGRGAVFAVQENGAVKRR